MSYPLHSVSIERKKSVVQSLQKYPPFLSYKQVAEILSVPIQFVYKMAHNRMFPRVVLGKKTVRVPKQAIIDLILQNWQESFEEAWERIKQEGYR